jgi:hypothetical protein
MKLITDTLDGLVRRKLWPVALVLVGALAAVPMLLAKDPDVAPTAVAQASKSDGLPATFVSVGDSEEGAARRRVLGVEKDPFEPAELSKALKAKRAKAAAKAKAAEAEAKPSDSDAKDSSSSGSGDTPSGSGGTTPPVSAAPTATPTPTVTIPAYSVKVRFGTTESEELPASTIERLAVLPDEENPLVVYRGVDNSGKVAIFELTGDVTAEGDGTCAPTPEDCQYVKLRAGETEFITVNGSEDADAGDTTAAQFQLDLLKIYKKDTKEKATDPATTAQSLAKAASSSLKGKSSSLPLRRRNRYVFDAKTGTLHRAGKGAKTPLSSL